MTVKRTCGAKKSKGGLCANPAGYGTDHPGFGKCKRHMGSTPAVATAAYREQVASMGTPFQIEPAEAMAREIARGAGHVRWLEMKVAAFELAVHDEDGEEYMNPSQRAIYSVYCAERKNLVETAALAIKAGLAERTVRLAEAQAEMLALAIDRILGRLQLTDAQLQLVPDVVPMVLREIPMERLAIEA